MVAPKVLSDLAGDLYSLASLASYIEKDCEVKTLSYEPEIFVKTLQNFKPEIVGVSAYTTSYPQAIQIMQQAKAVAPKAKRIIGGVHISCLPQSLHPIFDFGIIGDGEEPLSRLVSQKSDMASLAGTCYFEGDKIKINTPTNDLNVEKLPLPNLERYAKSSCARGCVGFVTSRGCPFQCVFCYSKLVRKKVSYYTEELVADYFEYAVRRIKANYIMLWDDTICCNIDRLSRIADELEKKKLGGFRVSVNIRSSIVSEELCETLQRLKVVSWNCGFESGSDRMLNQIKGNDSSLTNHIKTVQLAHRYGVRLSGSFIFGMPNETFKDMQETLEFLELILREKHTGKFSGGVWFFCASPLPGTAWWDAAMRQGKVSIEMDWKKLALDNWRDHLLLDPSVSTEQFNQIPQKATKIAQEINCN